MSPSIILLLRQELIWHGQDGRRYDVENDMGHSYRVALLNYLRRNAARLRDHALWYDVTHGGDNEESLSRSLDASSSLDWMNDQPLVRRLVQLINRHDSIEPDIPIIEGRTGVRGTETASSDRSIEFGGRE